MLAPTLTGPQYLAQGLKLVLSPGLRLFVLLPLAVNTLLFIGMIVLAMQQFGGWVDTFMPGLPSWLSFLEYLLWPLFVVLVLVVGWDMAPDGLDRKNAPKGRWMRRSV